MEFKELAQAIQEYHPSPNLALLEKAYKYSYEHHANQVRASGEPYFIHLFETAQLACKLKLDTDSVAAALLHDVIEDCGVTHNELKQEFNQEIADIVEGVSKLTSIRFDSKVAKQAENFRKMLVAMAKDVRVVLVKLCDRLHNMRTLEHLPDEKRARIAHETQEIYAPIANRLGLYPVKSELEDLCFLNLRPVLFKEINDKFQRSKTERQKLIDKTVETIKQVLKESGVSAKVSGRSKHYYSIWQKMQSNNLAFEEIHDLLAFRVIVPTLRACYETLGIVHASWKPVPGLFKDYVAMPKPNMYQSLHTTVIGPEGQRIEIQIRTPEMHQVAEEGVAAHWRYKEGGKSQGFDLQWIRDMVESQKYLNNPDEFLQSVKTDLFPEDIFVFTPDGDLIRLPFESTPIDFAYYVHTDVGNKVGGAKVNGQMVALSYTLNSGDTVEIITNKNQTPKRDWLNFAKSSKARQKIRTFLKSAERERSRALGIEMLTKELSAYNENFKKLEKTGKILHAAKELGLKSVAELYADIGYGKIKVKDALKTLFPNLEVEEKKESEDQISILERIFRKAAHAKKEKVGVRVAGLDNVLIRFARCCEPLPGDRIVGYVTRGRGVSIHRSECSHILDCDPQRLLKVSWEDEVDEPRKVRITLVASDRIGLLAAVSTAISDLGAYISYSDSKVDLATKKSVINFDLMVESADQLDKVRRAVEMIPGIIKVERVMSR